MQCNRRRGLLRREIVPFAIVLTLTALSLLAGCGGSSTPESNEYTGEKLPVTGRVVPVPGSSLVLTDLTVAGALDRGSVTADGAFAITESGTGPARVGLFDKRGRLILYGYVDAATGTGEVSAKQTAVALLFDATASFTLPPEMWKQALAVIGASPQADTVAGVITTRVAANPTALMDGDTAIANAVETAARILAPEGRAARSRSAIQRGARITAANATATRFGSISKIVVNTQNPQSGISVLSNPDGNGLIFKNDFRRHVQYFIYRSGYQDQVAGGSPVDHDVFPWELVTSGFVPSVSGANSAITTLVDIVTGSVAYARVYSEPIYLPSNPPDATRTYYRIVVCGPGERNFGPVDPAAPSMPDILRPATRYQQQEWIDSSDLMDKFLLFKDMLLPAVFTLIPADRVAKGLALNKDSVQLAMDIVKFMAKGGVDIATPLANHDYKGALRKFTSALATNATIRNYILQRLVQHGLISIKDNAAELMASSAARIVSLLRIVDIVLLTTDVGTIFASLVQSNALEGWDVTAVPAQVSIDPAKTDVLVGASLKLTCHVPGITGNFAYHWYTSGQFGHLQDDKGHSGVSFDSTSASVDYVADKMKDGDIEAVAVEVYLLPEGGVGQKQEVGKATAFLKGLDSKFVLDPVSQKVKAGASVKLTVKGLQSGLGTYEYQWSIAQPYFGHLDDAQLHIGTFITTPSDWVFFVADSLVTPGTVNTVTARVLLHPTGGGNTIDLGTQNATVTAAGALTLVPTEAKVRPYDALPIVLDGATNLVNGTLTCNWTLSGTPMGTLNGSKSTTITTSVGFVKFYPNDTLTSGDTNTVSVHVLFTPATGGTQDLGTYSCVITANVAPLIQFQLTGDVEGTIFYPGLPFEIHWANIVYYRNNVPLNGWAQGTGENMEVQAEAYGGYHNGVVEAAHGDVVRIAIVLGGVGYTGTPEGGCTSIYISGPGLAKTLISNSCHGVSPPEDPLNQFKAYSVIGGGTVTIP